MKKNFVVALIKVLVLCIIIFSISAYFVYDVKIIGWTVFGLGLLCLIFLKFSKIALEHVWPDIVFGLVDNGILAVMAVIGGEVAGVTGAIIGGVVGNSITDGIAGIFEGEIAEKLREKKILEERTMLGSAVGKMAGCLLGAGVILVIASFI
ncbi:MAG TPA: hypothetical protein VJC14_03090 [Candidatus Paceibacterota bacterium]